MKEALEIGDRIQDEVSKKEGIITSYTKWLYGCDRVAIHHGLDRDGKPLEHLWLDYEQCLLIKKQEVVKTNPNRDCSIKLGDRIKCRITGLEGIAFGTSYYMYGCTRIALAPSSLDRDGKPKEMLWADYPQFEIIKEKEIKRENNNTGGPMDSIPTSNFAPARRY
jgi:hypothetical protein